MSSAGSLDNKKPIKKLKEFSGASPAGFHFMNLYQCCPRKFYIRWFLRLKEEFTARPLIYGAAFHEAKATWYNTGDKEAAIAKGIEDIEKAELLFENERDYSDSLYRIAILIDGWIEAYGKNDLKYYDVVAVEKEIQVNLNGFVFTGRPDTLLRGKKTGKLIGMETKTSGFSKDVTLNGVYYGDQATAYYLLVLSKYGEMLSHIVPDVAYWNSRSSSGSSKPDFVRGLQVYRTKDDIDKFGSSVMQVSAEIASKVSACESDEGLAFQLFPRNSYYCTAYGKVCEFATICRLNINRKQRVPAGFKRDKAVISLSSQALDSLAAQ